ncbi:probable G-protein coupled receptor Mth-like 5 [Phlebotomus papatasi]|uniref:probable G-protein coupled receptor Mth-like 5 n=1 Tax=Phlebotomus papatasi TaxID=29031 RepID=UPI0024838C2D|nr:probable G-protein coupled receptor Mth-like 5 [Phlebotomus papatasi]XP_055712643.1 probable G-protein coupled receptor Mth-like 5 [Phlebotomus papatasi]
MNTRMRMFSVLLTVCFSLAFAIALPQKSNPNAIRVNKCCEKFELLVDAVCTNLNDSAAESSGPWAPIFTGYNGEENVQVAEWRYIIGLPDCGPLQMWPIYHYITSADKLVLLPDGKMRHFIKNSNDADDFHKHIAETDDKPMFYDYEPGQYCMDKAVLTKGAKTKQAQFAIVCSPEKVTHWTDTDFLLRKIINPIFHGISMIILLIIAIIYFVLPSLRDLVGNIVTTITVCLIVNQAADLVRIFTEFSSHVSFLVADTIHYLSLLAAFFWLNSMGYYIWKTFRSRNVFLRVTDGRKYCWYSGYAWGSTIVMSGLATFAHVFLDTAQSKRHSLVEDQESMGWLGIAMFFTPIAVIISINIFFYVTTQKIINRMNTYGRIHHKLKASFVMFSLMFAVMSLAWLFLVLSWVRYDVFLYTHIVVNALQAPLLLYICVLRQKHVTFLLKKSCCYNEPPSATDWGDEMTYMNGGDY